MSRNAWTSSPSGGCGCLTIVLSLLLLVVAFAIGPLLVMLLWNWIAVDLFAAPFIGFWEAFALKWLCSLLFGSIAVVKNRG